MKNTLLILLLISLFYQLNARHTPYEIKTDSLVNESLLENNSTSLNEFECENSLSNIPDLTLALTGSGTSSITLQLASVSRDIEFTIIDLDQRTNGNLNNRYIDLVNVSYVDGDGDSNNYGAYSGSGTSSTEVFIANEVQSVTITLEDSYPQSSSSNLSVMLQNIQYCNTPCSDEDDDGVCDEDDLCPGSDDMLDDDKDAIPDGCDDCITITTSFKDNPLQHLGTGACYTSVDLEEQQDISFTISDLDSRLNGTEKKHFVDNILIEYVNGEGELKVLGPYSASELSEVQIEIPGVVLSVRVILENELDTDAELSIELSDITSCAIEEVPSLLNLTEPVNFLDINNSDEILSFKVYPIPFNESIKIDLSQGDYIADGVLIISDILGRSIHQQKISWRDKISMEVNTSKIKSGIYFITYKDKDQEHTHQITKFR